jgi:hypothetical protein
MFCAFCLGRCSRLLNLIQNNECVRKLSFNAFQKFSNFSFLKSKREGGAPSLATSAHKADHDCLLSSGLWEMTQFDMSSVNRYCVVAERK